MHTYIPHEKKLLEIQRVSNPTSRNQHLSTPAYSIVHKSENTLGPSYFFQIQQKGVYGVESLLPRSFLGCIYSNGGWGAKDEVSNPIPRSLGLYIAIKDGVPSVCSNGGWGAECT